MTTTLPAGKLFRYTADQIHNQIAQEIGELAPLLAERPDRVVDRAMNLERLRGQADVTAYLEKQFAEITVWGVKQNWTMTQVLLVQMDTVADLATQHPDDTGGSRLNDGKRAYNDGRREVLQYVARRLRYSEFFPGN
jgi:hypothetical protein